MSFSNLTERPRVTAMSVISATPPATPAGDVVPFKASKPRGKPQAHAKYWQELLGQHGGPVRRPLLGLTEAERETTRRCFASSGLRVA